MSERTVKVDCLARVEGEGALHVKVRDGRAEEVQLRIFEAPRFFEALLRGRQIAEAPDITARICGICPVAYQMSAVHAIERALDVQVDERVRVLRRLIYCGEWIQSHALHVYLLHAPDFLGCQDFIEVAKRFPEVIQRGLALKKTGNRIVSVVGGREIHPVNVRLGGFYRSPSPSELQPLLEDLKRSRDDALETVHWVAGFVFPELERDYEFVALRRSDEYPFNEGRIVSNRGVDIEASDFETVFEEEQLPHSSALHSTVKARGPYLVGPLARYNLNHDKLRPMARQAAQSVGLEHPCLNPFKSIVVRAVEMVQACDEAVQLIDRYEPPEKAFVDVSPPFSRASAKRGGEWEGCACTEAPRGTLYHRYRFDENGLIQEARIVPPTSQNQKSIEEDLREMMPRCLDLPDPELTWRCEQAIRNHDPCISCATHFIKLHVDRG